MISQTCNVCVLPACSHVQFTAVHVVVEYFTPTSDDSFTT